MDTHHLISHGVLVMDLSLVQEGSCPTMDTQPSDADDAITRIIRGRGDDSTIAEYKVIDVEPLPLIHRILSRVSLLIMFRFGFFGALVRALGIM